MDYESSYQEALIDMLVAKIQGLFSTAPINQY